jgi:predicted phage-related endonuclease
MSLLCKKVGSEPAFSGNAATEHGNKYEPVAIEMYERITGEKVISLGLMDSLNEDEGFLAGSPDGLTANGRLIEVKCPVSRKPNGTVPSHYMHQLQCLMHILQLSVCDFIEYVPAGVWSEEVFSIVEVRRDDAFWARISPQLRRFWDEVLDVRVSGVLPSLPKRGVRKRPEPAACMIDPVVFEKSAAEAAAFVPSSPVHEECLIEWK